MPLLVANFSECKWLLYGCATLQREKEEIIPSINPHSKLLGYSTIQLLLFSRYKVLMTDHALAYYQ